MSSAVIPKEQMSAFQRWEMASFNEPATSAPVPASTPAIVLPGIEEVAAIREAARTKGHDEGWAEGRAAGLAAGRAEAAAELQHLQQIAASFGHEVARADEVIAQQLLELALDLTKAMLKSALAVRPELVLPVVAEAIRYLPALQQPALLFLHPDDALLVKSQMSDELAKAGWRVADDAHLERGGCRVETASNQIDAAIDSRWQRLAAGLGRDSAWLDA